MKKIANILIIFLVSYFISGIGCNCNGKNNKKIYYDSQRTNSRHDQKINNFMFITSVRTLEEETVLAEMTASGYIIDTSSSHVFVITANHFCDPEYYKQNKKNILDSKNSAIGTREIIGLNKEYSRDLSIISVDKENDICLLSGIKSKEEKYKPVVFADEMPAIGDKVYTVAAPASITGPDMTLLFEGYFSGCETSISCAFSIPSTFGASGAAIYNKRGEVVSMIISVPSNFRHVSYGPSIKHIRKIVEELKNNVEIK